MTPMAATGRSPVRAGVLDPTVIRPGRGAAAGPPDTVVMTATMGMDATARDGASEGTIVVVRSMVVRGDLVSIVPVATAMIVGVATVRAIAAMDRSIATMMAEIGRVRDRIGAKAMAVSIAGVMTVRATVDTAITVPMTTVLAETRNTAIRAPRGVMARDGTGVLPSMTGTIAGVTIAGGSTVVTTGVMIGISTVVTTGMVRGTPVVVTTIVADTVVMSAVAGMAVMIVAAAIMGVVISVVPVVTVMGAPSIGTTTGVTTAGGSTGVTTGMVRGAPVVVTTIAADTAVMIAVADTVVTTGVMIVAAAIMGVVISVVPVVTVMGAPSTGMMPLVGIPTARYPSPRRTPIRTGAPASPACPRAWNGRCCRRMSANV